MFPFLERSGLKIKFCLPILYHRPPRVNIRLGKFMGVQCEQLRQQECAFRVGINEEDFESHVTFRTRSPLVHRSCECASTPGIAENLFLLSRASSREPRLLRMRATAKGRNKEERKEGRKEGRRRRRRRRRRTSACASSVFMRGSVTWVRIVDCD